MADGPGDEGNRRLHPAPGILERRECQTVANIAVAQSLLDAAGRTTTTASSIESP